jgi:hypothetical protein
LGTRSGREGAAILGETIDARWIGREPDIIAVIQRLLAVGADGEGIGSRSTTLRWVGRSLISGERG